MFLKYDQSELNLNIPPHMQVDVFQKQAMPIIENTQQAVQEAFAHPVNIDNLTNEFKGKKSACILICDITRPVPNHLFLRPMVEMLMGYGISKDQICILIATGLHRPNEGEELKQLIKDQWVLDHVRIENHFARDDENHTFLGHTPTRNTPVSIDKRFVDADIKIATGLVEPHFMAGYSGGRKVISPGIAHADTIRTFHNFKFIHDPNARNCNFIQNPLHEEQLEIVKMLGKVYALNTVIDEHRNLSYVNFGEIIQSHLEAVAFTKKYAEVDAPQKYQTVVTSSAGYPLDKTYYQTIKGMAAALGILQKGGNLIIASSCSEGLGSEEFCDAQSRLVELGPNKFLEEISKKSLAGIDEWQTHVLAKTLLECKIFLYSDRLSQTDKKLTAVNISEDIIATIEKSIQDKNDAKIALIPEGPYIIPKSN